MTARSKYVPTITTVDLWPDVINNVGNARHDGLIDELAVLQGPGEEELVLLYEQSRSYEDVGRVLGISQETAQVLVRRIRARNRCPRKGCCGSDQGSSHY